MVYSTGLAEERELQTVESFVIRCNITGVIYDMFGDRIEIIPGKENDKVVEVTIVTDYYNETNRSSYKCEHYCGIADEKDFIFNLIFNHYFES